MEITKSWKIAGASAALVGFGAGTVFGLTPGGADDNDAERINLRDQRPAATAPAPDPVEGDDLNLEFDRFDLSPDGESIDSPLQSADDSPEGGDSVDTPGEGPTSIDSTNSVDWNSPRSAASPASVQSVASVASPDPAPAPAPAPAPQYSVDSPPSVQSVASVASVQSADSPD